ncbi:hypothetical protein Tco_1121098 [Tanacetum coccineum]|uniref:Uncharacterized protein n=1 Tax=Tanacetum coccineum TaxID=301880 RepID=A0ABQ5IZN3_9ASTR
MQEPSKSGTRKEVPPSHPKDKGKAKMIKLDRPSKKKDQIKFDEEMAKRLAKELQAKLEEEERVAKQKEEDANIAEWDDIQAMMDADFELAARLQIEEQGKLTIEERSRLFVERMDERKRHFARLRAKEKRRKPPIKTQKRNQMWWKEVERILKAVERKHRVIFTAMLDDFGLTDVLDLSASEKRNLESSRDITFDKAGGWRLYDSCGIHVLLMDTGITIHMLVERKYPLTQEMLSRMLSKRLEVDHEYEMAYELLRFTRSQFKK